MATMLRCRPPRLDRSGVRARAIRPSDTSFKDHGRGAASSESALNIGWQCIRGFRALHFVGPCVTVFGSARFREAHPYYTLTQHVGRCLAEAGFTVMTGGGPG